jgi:protein-S-isoprenylcysteine O-methyltransferase Ste14
MENISKFVDDQKNFSFIVMGVITFVGLVIKLAFGTSPTKDGTDGPASSSVYGYGIVAFSILSGIFLTFSLASKEYVEDSKSNQVVAFFKLLLKHSLHPILLFIILLWIIAINVNYYTKINKGNVTKEFFQFSTLSNILIILQIIILFIYLKEQTEGRKSQMTQLLYILASLNLIFAAMMNIVVKYFSTDG